LYYTNVSDVVKSRSALRSRQAEQTRQQILEAARHMFGERGFAGTRIEDVADTAGVAVPTVYKVFTNKRNLLVKALNRAMTADSSDAGIDRQAWFQEQLDEPDPDRQLRLIARNARHIYQRAAPVLDAVRASCPLDPEIARVWDQISADRLDRSRTSAKRFLAKAAGRARFDTEQTALTLWSLTGPELYIAHTSIGRTPDQYEQWLADILLSSLQGKP